MKMQKFKTYYWGKSFLIQNSKIYFNRLLIENNKLYRMIFFVFFCSFIVLSGYGQNVFDTQGVVKNTYGHLLKEVNITLVDSHNKIIQRTVTIDDGSFLLNIPDSFPQIVEISHVSYDNCFICLQNKSQLYLIREIILQNKSNELSELQVTGSKPKMYFRKNALVVNISKNPNYQSQLLPRVLRNMPGTEIDNKGNITLYGKSVAVYIDGILQKTVTPKMLERIISSYPTKAIEEIELNSNSDGQLGSISNSSYINIITKKDYHDGSLITLAGDGISYRDSKYTGGVNGAYIYSKGNFSFNTCFSYDHDYDHSKSNVSTYRHNEKFLEQNSESRDRTNVYMGSFNANYKFCNGDIISAYFDFYDDFSKHNHKESMNTFSPIEEKTNIIYGSNRGNADQWIGCLRYMSNPKYKHSFLLQYSYMFGGREKENNSLTRDNETTPYLEYNAKMQGGIHDIFAKYKFKPYKGGVFEAYINPSYGRLNDWVSYDNEHNDINNKMRGHETNLKFQVSYIHTFTNNIVGKVNLGGQYTEYDVQNKGETKEKFHFFDFMPYTHIQYISDNQNYSGTLAFVTNVTRPQYHYMLTGIRYIDDYNYTVGSADIKSQFSYGAVLQQMFLRYIFLKISYYRENNVSGLAYSSKGYQTIGTYCNYADCNLFDTYLNVPYQLFSDKLSGNLTLNATHYELRNLRNGYELNSDQPTSYWDTKFTLSANYSILKNFGIYASYRYSPSGYKDHQMKTGACSALDCGMYWDPLKNGNITITFDAFDVFDTYNTTKDYYYSEMSKKVNSQNKNNCYLKLGLVFNLSRGKKQESSIKNAPVDKGRFH